VQQRSIETRNKVVEAAVATLAEQGFAGTTVNEICERAGVSQGGLFRHFASKETLYTAVIEHVFADFTAQFLEELPKLGALARDDDTLTDRARRLVGMIWEIFHTPTLLAGAELYVAARVNEDLAQRLAMAQASHRGQLLVMVQAFFPDHADHPDLVDLAFVAVDAIRGFILGNFGYAHPALVSMDRPSEQFLDLVTTILTNHLVSTVAAPS